MARHENHTLEACLALIEEREKWGPAGEWSTADFEELSDRIAGQTGRTLGATTLKRVWGRVRYDSSPSRHTLDTLALYVGAASWREFQGSVPDRPTSTEPLAVAASDDPVRRLPVRMTSMVIMAAVAMLVVFWMARDGSNLVADPTDVNVSFSSRKVADGLPNSVVFDYQLAGVDADSFFIQQSWDPRLRHRVDPENSQFTSIYYYPGHFQAKLMADTLVLREHALVVPTNGWDILVEREGPTPIYADPASGEESLRLDSGWIRSSVPDLLSGQRAMNVYAVGQFAPLPSQSAVLRTRIRLDVDTAFSACQAATITLMATTGWIAVPFARTGCSSEMNMTVGDRRLDGQTTDLSALGTDLSEWTDLVIAVRDRLVFIEINGEPVYQAAYTQEIGDIIGLRYRFEGNGMIQTAELTGSTGENILPPFADHGL